MSTPINLPLLSVEDQARIDELLDHADFPQSTNFHSELGWLDYFRIHYWSSLKTGPVGQIVTCSFCGQDGFAKNQRIVYHNGHLEWYACESCFSYIWNDLIDPVNPGDNPVSLMIRKLICKSIDAQFCLSTQVESYFDEYKITFNQCMLCNQTIANEKETYIDIMPLADKYLVAHTACQSKEGFSKLLSKEDYDAIIKDELQDKLDEAL